MSEVILHFSANFVSVRLNSIIPMCAIGLVAAENEEQKMNTIVVFLFFTIV